MLKNLYELVVNKIKGEPAAVIGALASAAVYLAAQVDVVIDEASVAAVIGPFVLSLITRIFVSPASRIHV